MRVSACVLGGEYLYFIRCPKRLNTGQRGKKVDYSRGREDRMIGRDTKKRGKNVSMLHYLRNRCELNVEQRRKLPMPPKFDTAGDQRQSLWQTDRQTDREDGTKREREREMKGWLAGDI